MNALQGFILFCVIFFDSNMITLIKCKILGLNPEEVRRKSRRSVTTNEHAQGQQNTTTSTSDNLGSIRRLSKFLPQKLRRESKVSKKDDAEEQMELKEPHH